MNELTAENLKNELTELLNNENKKEKLKEDYAELKKTLSEGGNASAKAADSIFRFLKK
jgi:lipid-A-disaccharide synthase